MPERMPELPLHSPGQSVIEMFGRSVGCQPCRLAKRMLDDAGVQYVYHDIEADPSAAESLRALGFQSVPVFKIEGLPPFGGLDTDKIRRAIARLAA